MRSKDPCLSKHGFHPSAWNCNHRFSTIFFRCRCNKRCRDAQERVIEQLATKQNNKLNGKSLFHARPNQQDKGNDGNLITMLGVPYTP
eukprot:1075774-Amphidinium_carterae.1